MAGLDGRPHSFEDAFRAVQFAFIEWGFEQLHLRFASLRDHGKSGSSGIARLLLVSISYRDHYLRWQRLVVIVLWQCSQDREAAPSDLRDRLARLFGNRVIQF